MTSKGGAKPVLDVRAHRMGRSCALSPAFIHHHCVCVAKGCRSCGRDIITHLGTDAIAQEFLLWLQESKRRVPRLQLRRIVIPNETVSQAKRQ
jgi:hypothetical protein